MCVCVHVFCLFLLVLPKALISGPRSSLWHFRFYGSFQFSYCTILRSRLVISKNVNKRRGTSLSERSIVSRFHHLPRHSTETRRRYRRYCISHRFHSLVSGVAVSSDRQYLEGGRVLNGLGRNLPSCQSDRYSL